MNAVLEKHRRELQSEYFFQKEYLSDEETKKIESEHQNFSELGYSFDAEKSKWYKKVLVDITDEEINSYNSLLMLKYAKEMNEKQSTMKNIMIFWLVLTILNLLGSLYVAIKILDVFTKY